MKAEHSIFVTAIRLAKKVRAEFERAVQLEDRNLAAQSDLAEFFIEAPGFLGGGVDKARRTAEKIASNDPATAHWIQARIAEKDKRPSDAEKEYRAAIAAARDKAPYYLNVASFYRRLGRYSEMEQAIDNAASAERSHDDVLFEGAELLVRSGRNFPTATEWLRRYLTSSDHVESAPTFQAHYLLGSILEKQGNRQGAAAEYRQALTLASAFEPAQEALRRVTNQ
jgi:tetratricopeptide (TPR) repeat protein